MSKFNIIGRLTSIALLASLVTACGQVGSGSDLRDRLNDRVIEAQVSIQSAVEDPKQWREFESEMAAEQEAIAEADAQMHELADEESAAWEARKATVEARVAQENPLAGRPASELSSQLPP